MSRNGSPGGRGGPGRVRERSGPAGPSRGRESDADELGSWGRIARCGPSWIFPPTASAAGDVRHRAHRRARTRRDVSTLPLAAVIKEGKESLCCCVENGRIVRKPIRLGLETADDVEVLAGLAASDSRGSGPSGVLAGRPAGGGHDNEVMPMATTSEAAKRQASLALGDGGRAGAGGRCGGCVGGGVAAGGAGTRRGQRQDRVCRLPRRQPRATRRPGRRPVSGGPPDGLVLRGPGRQPAGPHLHCQRGPGQDAGPGLAVGIRGHQGRSRRSRCGPGGGAFPARCSRGRCSRSSAGTR